MPDPSWVTPRADPALLAQSGGPNLTPKADGGDLWIVGVDFDLDAVGGWIADGEAGALKWNGLVYFFGNIRRTDGGSTTPFLALPAELRPRILAEYPVIVEMAPDYLDLPLAIAVSDSTGRADLYPGVATIGTGEILLWLDALSYIGV